MSATLLLNADYQALAVISWKRAMILVMDDRAEVIVGDEDDPVRSPSISLPRPVVVRLIAYAKIPWTARVALNKRNLYSRDKGKCQYCLSDIGIHSATIDHVIPRARGGQNNWLNVVLACGKCNFAKGDKLLENLDMTLHTTPTVPRREGGQILIGMTVNPLWEQFLLH